MTVTCILNLTYMPNTVVISAAYQQKYFGAEEAVGKMLKISDLEGTHVCEVTGVFEDFPANSNLHYDIIFSWGTITSGWPGFDNFWYLHEAYTYVALPSAAAARHIEAQFPAIAEKYKTGDALKDLKWGVTLVPLQDIHLRAQKAHEVEVKGSARAVWFMAAMALLVMLIAWINYTNLSTIKSIERLKEAGLRKIMGVARYKLALQFFLESGMVSGLAVCIAVVLVAVMQQGLLQTWLGLQIPFTITPWVVCLIGGTLVVAMAASGAYPALWLSAVTPARAMKGDMKNSRSGNRLRKVLLTCQFMGAIILMHITILVYRQVQFMKQHDTGLDTAQTIVINAPLTTAHYQEDLQSFKNDLLRQAAIAHVTYASSIPGQEVGMQLSNKRVGRNETALYEMLRTDYDYVNTYELELLSGRNFSRDFPTDETALLVNEESMRLLGFDTPEAALQQEVYLETSQKNLQSSVW